MFLLEISMEAFYSTNWTGLSLQTHTHTHTITFTNWAHLSSHLIPNQSGNVDVDEVAWLINTFQ